MKRLIIGGLLGAAGARVAYTALSRRPPGVAGTPGADLWGRTNHRGEPVTLLEGPAFVIGATAAGAFAPGMTGRMRAAALLAGAGAGALGAYDDLAGSASSRGFKGHLGALARGEVTSGAVKILGIGATGLAAAAIAGPPRPQGRPGGSAPRGSALAAFDVLMNGAIIAAGANLMNLFDLRPGRAIKVGLLAGAPLACGASAAVVAAPLGAAAALLPEDLGERAMLGDAGANALGALLGLAATRLGRRGRIAVLGGLVALNGASEFVSFTKVIQRTPPLHWLDMLGRRPVQPPVVPSPGTEPAAAQPSTAGQATTAEADATL